MISDRRYNVCFSGHRPRQLPDGGADPLLLSKLRDAVESEIAKGKNVFLNGAMAGFDILGAETVIRLRTQYPHIKCVTVAPYRISYFNNNNWTSEWKQRALAVYRQSDLAFALSSKYRRGVYYDRNDYLVEHSSAIICYYSGKIIGREARGQRRGGTEYTVDRAYDLGLRIQNLAAGIPEQNGGDGY